MRWLLTCGALLALCAPASGQTRVMALGGVSAFLNGQSLALDHLVKPVVRLQVDHPVAAGVRLGAEVVGVVASENYRLLGGYLVVAPILWSGDTYEVSLAAGAGAGTHPRILSTDLQRDASATLWVEAGLRQRWRVWSERLIFGLDLQFEHLSVVSVTAGVGLRFR